MTTRQLHNQPADSPLHQWLTRLWDTVRAETGDACDVRVCARNDGVAGGDPAVLGMLVSGEVEFFALMGGLLGAVVPVAEMQGLPFAFRDSAHVFAALDGPLGEFLGREIQARGLFALPGATFENGFRQITSATRPIRDAGDLAGLAIRTPAGRLFVDFFESLGARPRGINLDQLHAALRAGTVEAQENPLVVVEFNRLWEVQRYVSLTNHMWSGFNLLANLAAWRAIPAGARAVIERVAVAHAQAQRADTDALNRRLAGDLAARGLVFNTADTVSWRRRLGPFYARWRRQLGEKAWGLLETETGPLG